MDLYISFLSIVSSPELSKAPRRRKKLTIVLLIKLFVLLILTEPDVSIRDRKVLVLRTFELLYLLFALQNLSKTDSVFQPGSAFTTIFFYFERFTNLKL